MRFRKNSKNNKQKVAEDHEIKVEEMLEVYSTPETANQTTPLTQETKEAIDAAAQANGTVTADLVNSLDNNSPSYEQQQEQLKQQYYSQAAAKRDNYIKSIYGKLNWHSSFTLVKVLYKDFSSRLFLTFLLCLMIMVLSLSKIVLTYKSSERTIIYSKLLADKNSLSLSNENLRLEFTSLISQESLFKFIDGKFSFTPISQESEIIVIIPYIPDNQKLKPSSIPLLQ